MEGARYINVQRTGTVFSPDSIWLSSGLVEMVPGDIMLLRDAKHMDMPPTQEILSQDVLAVMVLGRYISYYS